VALGLAAGQGEEALEIARGMAMMTYRTSEEFAQRFPGGIEDRCPLTTSEPGGYLRARGRHFLSVMSPQRFLSLSASIDRHRVDPARITCPLLVVGADSDQLVRPDQLRSLAERTAGPAELHLRSSLYGHDMFLKEAEALGTVVGPFIEAAAE
jgi:homoserine O-acetyltransferase